MTQKVYSLSLGAKTLSIELTDLAPQANAAVMVRLGDTVVLVTVVVSKRPREGIMFLPLIVDYEEKFAAAGKILGSRFIRREARPSEEAILSGRLIDRSIRPLFPKKMRNDVQVIATVLAIDGANDPDIPAMIGASAALMLSGIPWNGPLGALRIGEVGGQFVICPEHDQREISSLDLVVAGPQGLVNMIEARAKEVPEERVLQALKHAQNHLQQIIALQGELRNELRNSSEEEKQIMGIEEATPEMFPLLNEKVGASLEELLEHKSRKEFSRNLEKLKEEWLTHAKEKNFSEKMADFVFAEEVGRRVHQNIIESEKRPDGRKIDEIRQLEAKVNVLPRVHGSGLFTRGETKILSTLTLGAPGDELMIQGMEIRGTKRFMHHYNFPPYSVGEIAPLRGPGRREIGHGALAERALLPIIPEKKDFPYTIRIVSDALSSNGSTSMGSVCASTLALMDAGVPITRPVAGIAMGLMTSKDGRFKVLTDLQGPEDHHGDMDFKIAGTQEGVTAMQLDVKIPGLTEEMIKMTFQKSKEARDKILGVMLKTIPSPRPELSQWAPRVVILNIATDKIRDVIGPGGKTINDIIQTTGATIDIEDDGTIFVTADTPDSAAKAIERIKQLTREVKVGEVFEGKVTRIFPFGAMMELGPRQEGLIHISELSPEHVERVEDVLKSGEVVKAKVISIDDQGRVNLSRRELIKPGQPRAPLRERRHLRPPGRSERRKPSFG